MRKGMKNQIKGILALAVTTGLFLNGLYPVSASSLSEGSVSTTSETTTAGEEEIKEETVTLNGTYHEKYDYYEFSLLNKYYFYSNVADGAIVTTAVKLDIPKNIAFTVIKDGKKYAYASKEEIKKQGTYVVTVQVEEKKVRYTGSFHFRIDKNVVKKEEPQDNTPQSNDSGKNGFDPIFAGGAGEEETDDSVQVASLVETYNADYDMYEEGFGISSYFYSNVANGSITDKTVKIDIPANISYVVEKDGKPVSYSPAKGVSEKGSYIIKMVSFEGNVEYNATFRFRIQENPNGAISDGISSEGENPDGFIANGENLEGATNVGENVSGDGSLGTGGDDLGLISGEGAGVENSASATEGSQVVSGVERINGLYEQYDNIGMRFLESLSDGTCFYASMPNGIITTSEMIVTFPDELTVEIYKDDVLYEYERGFAISQPGVYRIQVSSGEAVNGCFQFQIVGEMTNQLQIYYAPKEFQFTSVILDGESELLYPQDSYTFAKDGVYDLELVHKEIPGLVYEMTFTRDTVLPEVQVNQQTSSAEIILLSDDITTTELYQNDKSITYQSLLSEPGSYMVKVYDKAGNCVEKTFTLRYKINGTSVLAIVLGIALIAGTVVFVKRTRNKISVR